MSRRKHIKPLSVKYLSGYTPKPGDIPSLKKGHYFIEEGRSMSGEAPKHFIRVYEFGKCRKENPKTWPLYIAKLGHKSYPIESITEYLLNQIGEVLEFKMASSRLVHTGGQVRFLSRYFIQKEQEEELVHGADIYIGYLQDKKFVEEIAGKKKEREFFAVQFTYEALLYHFPDEADDIIKEFINLLVFDAFVGVMDRHIYNWGVLRNLKGKDKPRFSPIYDTARGLFWNHMEDKIVEAASNKTMIDSFIKHYADKSMPQIGWEGMKELNHFQLLELIAKDALGMKPENILKICSLSNLGKIFTLLDRDFHSILSQPRIDLIKRCLVYRQKRIVEILA